MAVLASPRRASFGSGNGAMPGAVAQPQSTVAAAAAIFSAVGSGGGAVLLSPTGGRGGMLPLSSPPAPFLGDYRADEDDAYGAGGSGIALSQSGPSGGRMDAANTLTSPPSPLPPPSPRASPSAAASSSSSGGMQGASFALSAFPATIAAATAAASLGLFTGVEAASPSAAAASSSSSGPLSPYSPRSRAAHVAAANAEAFPLLTSAHPLSPSQRAGIEAFSPPSLSPDASVPHSHYAAAAGPFAGPGGSDTGGIASPKAHRASVGAAPAASAAAVAIIPSSAAGTGVPLALGVISDSSSASAVSGVAPGTGFFSLSAPGSPDRSQCPSPTSSLLGDTPEGKEDDEDGALGKATQRRLAAELSEAASADSSFAGDSTGNDSSLLSIPLKHSDSKESLPEVLAEVEEADVPRPSLLYVETNTSNHSSPVLGPAKPRPDLEKELDRAIHQSSGAGAAPTKVPVQKKSAQPVIPAFYKPRAGVKGRVRAMPGNTLEDKLPVLLDFFRRHGSYIVNPLAAAPNADPNTIPPAKAAPPPPQAHLFQTRAQLEAYLKDHPDDKSRRDSLGRRDSKDSGKGTGRVLGGPNTPGKVAPSANAPTQAPSNPTVSVAGVQLSWSDSHLGLAVEQFAAVAKTLCNFPSFFAAPLFRRVRHQFAGASNNHGVPSSADPAFRVVASERSDLPKKDNNASSSARKDDPTAAVSVAVNFDLHETTFTSEETLDRDTSGLVSLPSFLAFWRKEMEPYDNTDRFFRLVKKRGTIVNRSAGTQAAGATQRVHEINVIEPADFMPFLEELLAFHPALAFLEQTPEFQEKYARTVIARIFYMWDATAKRSIDARNFRRSDIMQAFHTVDIEEEINLVLKYFSYEHFYVLYCKFWELDTDHDFLLNRADLNRQGDLTRTVLDRVYAQAGRPFIAGTNGRMGFEDFIVFFMAETDKTTEAALRYWFNVCDIDGDGFLSADDLRHFFREQQQRMRDWGMEVVLFEDVLCQMHDLLKPKNPRGICIEDFLNPEHVKLTGVLYNAMFNLQKFQAFESRDPVFVKQEVNMTGLSQWDKYAAGEYSRLASEEDSGQQRNDSYQSGGGDGMFGAGSYLGDDSD
jgi:Ca2+-binding EF-hand superfamily protein